MSIAKNVKEVTPVNVYDLKSKIMSYRRQEEWLDENMVTRLDTIIPLAMKRADLDCWIVACREYNEDPVFAFLTPTSMITARRTAIFVFYQNGDKVERYAVTRPQIGLDDLYNCVWVNQKGSDWCIDKEHAQTPYECLAELLHKLNPKKIGLNYSKYVAFADGLSKQMYDDMVAEWDEELKSKVVSAEVACVTFLETRTEKEMAAYNSIMEIANALIDHAYSNRVIVPGVTTNSDVRYFMMQAATDLGVKPWFNFECSILKPGGEMVEEEEIIMPGDILHCDIGIQYLGLCTDTQELCYICKQDEEEAPVYLQEMLAKTNRLQDIVVSYYEEGRTGDEVLALSRKQALEEGIHPCIYTHPLGLYGHAAGPYIGLCDQQNGVVGNNGKYALHNNTAYSLELNASYESKEFGGKFTCPIETDILFTNDKVYYLGRRQKAFHLVK